VQVLLAGIQRQCGEERSGRFELEPSAGGTPIVPNEDFGEEVVDVRVRGANFSLYDVSDETDLGG
jgi:hypothetical protein